MNQQILINQLDPDSLRELIRETVTEVMDQQTLPPSEPKFLTIEEVCQRGHISKPTFHEYRKRGILRAQRFGRRVLVAEADFLAALNEIPTLKRYRR